VPIIVPCHRVIGADGSLTGYGGGLQRKQALLDLEAAVSGSAVAPPVWAGRQLSLLA
jgi:methylated-DNA-[protein]-cysteine S-methyltransferase